MVERGLDLSIATATDLARALRKARQYEAESEAVLIDTAPDDEYSPKEYVVDAISFVLLDDGQLAVRCTLAGEVYIDDDTQYSAGGWLESRLVAFLQEMLA